MEGQAGDDLPRDGGKQGIKERFGDGTSRIIVKGGVLPPQCVKKLVFWHAVRRQESAGDKQLASVGVYRYGRTRVVQEVKMQYYL